MILQCTIQYTLYMSTVVNVVMHIGIMEIDSYLDNSLTITLWYLINIAKVENNFKYAFRLA